MKEFVEMRDVRKIFRMGEVEIAAADGIDFQIKKGEFAVLADDDVNFRSGPSTTADVLACLPRHSLLRLSGSKSGEWQKVEWNGKKGYIFAEYLEKPETEELIDEDNSLGDWHLGQIFDSSAAKSLGKVKKESKDGSSQVYDFQQLQVKARRGNKKIVELMTASPVIYTMRGIGTGDDGARVIGQYGIPARVVYLKDDKDGAVIMYGYNFPKNSKIGKSLDFYISRAGAVCRLVLSGEE